MSEIFPLPAGLGVVRRASRADVVEIVRLLADDPLGQPRETLSNPLPRSYYQAFAGIEADPNQFLAVVELEDGMDRENSTPGQLITYSIAGTFQLSFIPCLSYQGAWRAQLEGVRVGSPYRNRGLGRAMLLWVIEHSRQRGCKFLQLSSNKSRTDAIRFYQRLGFVASHEGMKLEL
jgi:ribosomal protein S18 acetylase RimI-like enzyme